MNRRFDFESDFIYFYRIIYLPRNQALFYQSVSIFAPYFILFKADVMSASICLTYFRYDQSMHE